MEQKQAAGKRERIVSFRVTDEEYEVLKVASEQAGAGSISDFARQAACGREESAGPIDAAELRALQERIDELFEIVNRLAGRVASSRPEV